MLTGDRTEDSAEQSDPMKPPPTPNNNAMHGDFGGRRRTKDNWFSKGLILLFKGSFVLYHP
jgi:hypothetical protein